MKEWKKLNGELLEASDFAIQHYPEFSNIPRRLVENVFKKYNDYTYLLFEDGFIKGFVVFQNYNKFYNGFMVCLPFGKLENHVKELLSLKPLIPKNVKEITWFDENKMKGRRIKLNREDK